MLASIFRKSNPINYILVLLGTFLFYFFYIFNLESIDKTSVGIAKIIGSLLLVLATLFIINFIIKKNGLSKDTTYTVFFSLLLLLFFPSILENIRLLLANFFVLLGIRRLISLQTLNTTKEKIFDACLWILLASIFNFWCILFLILVFISIVLHVATDYRNWIIPFIALFTVTIIFVFFCMIIEISPIGFLSEHATFSFRMDYFKSIYENIAFSLFVTVALFFLVPFFNSLSNRPQMLKSSYLKIIVWFFISTILVIVAPNKSNDLLLFTIPPIAMLATFYIELPQINWQKEVVVYFLLALALFCYFSQL